MKNLIQNIFDTNIPAKRLTAALLFFRVAVSLSLFNTHGLKKALDFAGTAANIPDPLGMGGTISAVVAILANVVATAFIALGLFTRPAALLILSVTLTGLFLVHAADPWTVKDVPLMYSLAFTLIFILGPGELSLDHVITEKLKA